MIELSKRNIHNIFVSVWFICLFFILDITDETKILINYFLLISGIILLGFSFYYAIRNREENRIKTFEEIISQNNIDNCGQVAIIYIFLSLYIGGFFGGYTYLALILFAILITIFVIYKKWKLSNEFYSSNNILNWILLIILIFLMKDFLIEHFGNEKIGSYFSKPDFEAKYLIRLSKTEDFKNAIDAHGIIQVTKENYPAETEDGVGVVETEIVIKLKEALLINGQTLEFDECIVDFGSRNRCSDQNESEWYIELTDLKLD